LGECPPPQRSARLENFRATRGAEVEWLAGRVRDGDAIATLDAARGLVHPAVDLTDLEPGIDRLALEREQRRAVLQRHVQSLQQQCITRI
jgi:hypothetical protein